MLLDSERRPAESLTDWKWRTQSSPVFKSLEEEELFESRIRVKATQREQLENEEDGRSRKEWVDRPIATGAG